MVESDEKRLGWVMAALSDPTRRQLMRSLHRGERSISELAKPLPLSFESVSKHLRVLEEAGLVERRRRGRAHLFTRRTDPLQDVSALVEELSAGWVESLDSLARQVEGATASPPQPKKRNVKGMAGYRTNR